MIITWDFSSIYRHCIKTSIFVNNTMAISQLYNMNFLVSAGLVGVGWVVKFILYEIIDLI